jgi:creatinine amidohydrolase
MARSTVFLDELTEPEVAQYLRERPTGLLLVPAGSTEQHGPHAPLGTDAIIPREVCRRVAEAKNALVAPAIPYGLSQGHQGFTGLAYLGVSTYIGMIEDLIRSFAESGFRRIVFVNGHYTNYPAINLACLSGSDKLPSGAHAWALSYWDALPPDEVADYLSLTAGLHANIGETSAVLAVRPELVKLERAVEGWPNFPEPKGPLMPTIFAYFETSAGSCYRALPHGVWGDPRDSSRELGEQFYAQITRAVCNVIDDVEASLVQMEIDQPAQSSGRVEAPDARLA